MAEAEQLYNLDPGVKPDVTQPVDPYKRVYVNPEMFGAGVGRALEGLGGEVQHLGDVWGQVQADGRANDAADQIEQLASHVESLQGQDALNAQKTYGSDLANIVKQGRSGLIGQSAIAYDRTIRPYQRQAFYRADQHFDTQGREYAAGQSSAGIENAYTAVGHAAIGTSPQGLDAIDTGVSPFINQSADFATKQAQAKYGLNADPEILKAARQRAVSGAYATAVESLEAKDPALAMQYLERHEPDLEKDRYAQIHDRLQGKAYHAQGSQALVAVNGQIDTAVAKGGGTAPVAANSDLTDYKARVAQIESASGRNEGPLKSYYQFEPGTWAKVAQPGDTRGTAAGEDAAMNRLTEANRQTMATNLGRNPTAGELYLAHQQGPQGALKLMAEPSRRAADIVGLKAIVGNGGTPNMSAGDFVRMWEAKFNGVKYTPGAAVASAGGGQPAYVPPGQPNPQFAAGGEATVQQAAATVPAEQQPPQEPTPEDLNDQAIANAQGRYAAQLRGLDGQDIPWQAKEYAKTEAKQQLDMTLAALGENAQQIKQKKNAAYGHVYDLLNQGNSQGAVQQAYKERAAGNITAPELTTTLDAIQRRSQDSDDPVTFGKSFQDVMQRIARPAGADGRIDSVLDIMNVANAGELTAKGEDRAIRMLKDRQEEERGKGAWDKTLVHASISSVAQGLKRKMSFDGEGAVPGFEGLKDPAGEEAFNTRFLPRFYSEIDAIENDPKKSQTDVWNYLADAKHLDELVKWARSPQDMERAKLLSAGQVADAGGSDPRTIPAPQGIQQDAWVNVVGQPAMVFGQDNKPTRMSTDQWAQFVGRLAANPRPAAIAAFDKKFPGHDGAAILQMLGVTQQGDNGAPAPAQPAAQPAPQGAMPNFLVPSTTATPGLIP